MHVFMFVTPFPSLGLVFTSDASHEHEHEHKLLMLVKANVDISIKINPASAILFKFSDARRL